MLLSHLYMAMTGSLNESLYLKMLNNKQNSLSSNTGMSSEEYDPEIIKTQNQIIQILKDKEVLVVLDGCEGLLEDEPELFRTQLDKLLVQCQDVKLLLTSRKFLNSLEHFKETSYHLHPLKTQESICLLLDSVTRKVEKSEIQELLEYKLPKDNVINEYMPVLNSRESNLINHPFSKLLGGHPQAIALVAPMLEQLSLTELFKKLLESNIIDFLENSGKQMFTSLRASIDILVKKISKTNPKALDLFKLIGMFPGGIRQVDITDLWGNKSWQSLKYDLLKASMIDYTEERSMLTLLPIMATRATELLEKDVNKKNELHLK